MDAKAPPVQMGPLVQTGLRVLVRHSPAVFPPVLLPALKLDRPSSMFLPFA
jgi:hypothetical protein